VRNERVLAFFGINEHVGAFVRFVERTHLRVRSVRGTNASTRSFGSWNERIYAFVRFGFAKGGTRAAATFWAACGAVVAKIARNRRYGCAWQLLTVAAMRWGSLLLLVLSGCGLLRTNSPAPLTSDADVDARAIRTMGALQVAFALRWSGATAPLLTLWVRNSGREKIPIDVSRLRVVGYVNGASRVLQLDDPRGELDPVHIEPGAVGKERIRLVDHKSASGELTRVCIDPAPMVKAAAVPVCFVPDGDSTWSVAP
jgi:hypothetical protein